ncbi:MAG TPA: cyanophycinase [Bacteroidales bacterium]|jgi:cyanophycinase|nr:cyanophycinase [Bacteroidales bacterium]HOU97261.1 cyanophycinase [Bacteroidales bacterium]
MNNIKLILIGGAEDKTDKLEILSNVAKSADYKNIVLIPTASAYPHEAEQNYSRAFEKLNVENFKTLDIRYPEECDKPEYIEAVEQANLLFFSGGDQVKLVETLRNSQLINKIKDLYFSGKLIIAGTSAGAAAASENMLFNGDYHGFIKGEVKHSKGFGFVDDMVIDTHFLNRERIPRLLQMLAMGAENKAIGLDEDTSIFIDKNDFFEVFGSGMVTLLNAEEMTYNDFHEIQENQAYNVNNVKIGFLSRGAKFNLKSWIVVQPQQTVIKDNQFIYDQHLIGPGAYI